MTVVTSISVPSLPTISTLPTGFSTTSVPPGAIGNRWSARYAFVTVWAWARPLNAKTTAAMRARFFMLGLDVAEGLRRFDADIEVFVSLRCFLTKRIDHGR